MTRLRVQRVNELIQRVLAEEVTKKLNSAIKGFVTIRSVSTNRDFSQADVFFSVFGADEDVAQAQEVFEEARANLQTAVGREVRLRHTPQLNFIFDDGEGRAARIDRLLDEEKRTREESGADASAS